MLSKKLNEAINIQIKKELFSEYLYLSMSAYFYSKDLDGFANFFMVQCKEEHFHAMKFFNFVLEKGGEIELLQIEKPEKDFNSAKEIFEKSLDHERFVTESINELMDLARSENDHSVVSFLNWYVDEQVEEESMFQKHLNKLNMIGENGPSLLMMDKELAQRVYTAPPEESGQTA